MPLLLPLLVPRYRSSCIVAQSSVPTNRFRSTRAAVHAWYDRFFLLPIARFNVHAVGQPRDTCCCPLLLLCDPSRLLPPIRPAEIAEMDRSLERRPRCSPLLRGHDRYSGSKSRGGAVGGCEEECVSLGDGVWNTFGAIRM